MTNDVIDLPNLPHAVRDKLLTIRETVTARSAVVAQILGEMEELRRQRAAPEEYLRQSGRDAEIAGDEAGMARTKENIERLTASILRLSTRYAELSQALQTSQRLKTNLESYFSRAASKIILHEGTTPRLQNGETAIDGIDRAARRTRALKADRREILAAPLPSALAKQFALAQLKARAEAAKPIVFPVVEHGAEIEFPTVRMQTVEHVAPQQLPVHVYGTDVIGILAWLFLPQFEAAIDAEIDAAADDSAALSPQERAAKLAEIDADILSSEREEAALAELAGLLPRDDIDPRAVLGLGDTMPAPAREF